MGSIRQSFGIAAVLGMAMASSALAQDDARSKLMIPEEAGLTSEVGHFPRGSPGTSTGSPIAFGANWGDIYIGAGLQAPIRYSTASDGGATVGMGFANAQQYVGLDVGLTFLSTVRSGLTNRMGLSAKIHKIFGENWGVAVGVENIYISNQPVDGNPSVYAVVSKVMDLSGTWLGDFRSLTISAGAGNEDFRLEKDVRAGNKTIAAFGSAALRIWEPVSLIVDWPGQDLNVGVSIVPFKEFPLVLTPAINDLTGLAGTFNYGTGTVRPRFSLGAGLAFKF
jgi:hypothetical protein